ncbi:helix-turn-helix transcriptional regulator [Shimia abyssi]|uniref:AlpA family transcriptional regulator n=1 Tax=Shimia abyssi TaxID=1662395 RepID=A0A2P8FIV9_9RHOB|nr:AlpA family transcriptional regulator [Shimia abyssi]
MVEKTEKYRTFAEVASRYHTSRSTIYRWLSDPVARFPRPFRIGHRCLWRSADLDAFDEGFHQQSEGSSK